MSDGKNSSLAGAGHNSMDRTKLNSYRDRYSNILNEIDDLKEALKDIETEVESAEFSKKAFKKAIKIHRLEKEKQEKLAEEREESDRYLKVMGTDIFG